MLWYVYKSTTIIDKFKIIDKSKTIIDQSKNIMDKSKIIDTSIIII